LSVSALIQVTFGLVGDRQIAQTQHEIIMTGAPEISIDRDRLFE